MDEAQCRFFGFSRNPCCSGNPSSEPRSSLSYSSAIKGFLAPHSVYPELVAVVGGKVPDYRGRFLRGLQPGHSVGQTVANSIKSHNHTQPAHTHSFSGQLVSTALSGTAAGQKYSSSASLSISGSASGQTITNGGAGGQSFSYAGSSASSGAGETYVVYTLAQNTGSSAKVYTDRTGDIIQQGARVITNHLGGGDSGDGIRTSIYIPNTAALSRSQTLSGTTSGGAIWGSTGGGSISGTANGTVAGTANASSVSGSLRNGSVSGTIGASGGDPTDYTGGSETAPEHIYVRCLIRAKP